MTSTSTTPGGLSLTQVAGIRRFDDPHLQAAIDRAVAALPAGRRVVVVGHASVPGQPDAGASMSLLVRLGDTFSVAAAAYKPYAGKLEGEAEILWTPF